MAASQPDPVLRPAGPADAAAIRAIYAHHVLYGSASFEEIPPDAAEIERRRVAVTALGLPYLVAEREGQIVGYAYLTPYRPRSAYRFTVENSIYVAAAEAGHGIGRMLLTELILVAVALGMRQMIAVIGDSANHASIALHERQGFVQAGVFRSVAFKHGRWLDSVLMQRALGPGDTTLPDPLNDPA
ncbi:MAG: N-acetyltransferase family protein [Dongiaceae bacterium]